MARVRVRARRLATLPPRSSQAVRAERPDLLHTHMVHGDVYGAIAANTLRLPFVSSRHNDDRYLLGPFRYVDRGSCEARSD